MPYFEATFHCLCYVHWLALNLFIVSSTKSEQTLHGEALWTFGIHHYLFFSFIQFTAGKKQGSHQIPQSSPSLPSYRRISLSHFPEKMGYISIRSFFFSFLVSIFILHFIKLWNVITQQPKFGAVLYVLQGYSNLIGTWFHMRNMNWFMTWLRLITDLLITNNRPMSDKAMAAKVVVLILDVFQLWLRE